MMNNSTTTLMETPHNQYRLEVYSMNHSDGWTEYATLEQIKSALAADEETCRSLAAEWARDNRAEFNPQGGLSEKETDDAIEHWIHDIEDENGNAPDSDVAIFTPYVQKWEIDEDGDAEWQSIDVLDLP